MRPFPIFHEAERTLRFWVPVNGTSVCALVSDTSLRCCFAPVEPHKTVLTIFDEHLAELDEIVRRRIASGDVPPVRLHDSDFPVDAAGLAEFIRRESARPAP